MKKALLKTGKILLMLVVLITALGLSYYILHFKPFNKHRLDKTTLDESLLLGRAFLLNNQKEEGNFNYQYNYVEQSLDPSVSPVRQAGALWGLTLIHQAYPTAQSKQAILKGISFYAKHTREIDSSRLMIIYPGVHSGSTGTMALASLAIVDFLRAEPEFNQREELEELLSGYINFLASLQMDDGLIYSSYSHIDGRGTSGHSPYFDGETLLALSKAAKYMGYAHLKEMILTSAESMYQTNVVVARQQDEDSDVTKGFYQWSSMAFYEIYEAGWDDKYGERVIDLAYWMIDTHKTLRRRKNTAYAHEGMIHAWEIARLQGNKKAQKKIGKVIDKGLYKLTSWQINGPNENLFLAYRKIEDPLASGGIMNFCCDKELRIDVTQHQMHAVILARKYIYKAEEQEKLKKTE